MIENEQRVRLPRLLANELDTGGNTLKEVARLHPSKLSIDLNMQPLSTATMIIPEEDPDIVMHDFVEIYNQHGSCGIFRVVDIQPAYGKNRTLTLNHALDILNDAVYPSNTEEYSGTVSAFLTKLIGAQKQKIGNTAYWQLGTVSDTGTWHQEFNYDNVLELIKQITSEHEDYYYTFDFSVFPWQLNLIARNDDVLTEFRASRNIDSCKVTLNDSDQCTRLYLSITTKSTVTEGGRTAGKKSTVTFEVHDDQQGQAVWGVIEKTAGIETDKVPASEKAAWVQGYFERHRDPTVQISIDGRDLKEQTGESIDEMHLGRVCRAALPRYNTTFLERIVTVSYPDALRQPDKVSVSMANKRQTTEDNIASAQKEAKKAGGGGGAAKQQAENNATEIEFQKIRYDLQVVKDEKRFAVIATESWYEQMEGGGETLVGQYTANVQTTARKLTSAFNVTGVKLDSNGDPVIDEETGDYVFDGGNNSLSSQVDQTAAAIRSEVTRATGAESSLSSTITQTAGEIRTEVSQKVDQTTYNSYVSQTATQIAAKVGKTDVTITNNGISITGVSGSLDISGLRTSVGALEADHVSTDDLDATNAVITNLRSGSSSFTGLSCTGNISTGSITSVGGFTTNSGTFTGHTIKITSVNSATFLGLGDLTLDHSHGITCSADASGQVTITLGAAQSSNGSDSFNMAATTWYAGRVTAFKSAVSTAMGNARWNASGGVSIYASLDTANKRVAVTSATASITYPGDASPTSVNISLGNLDVTTALDNYYAAAQGAMGVTSSWNDNVLTFSAAVSNTKTDTVTITADHSCVYNPSTHQYTITGSALADGTVVKTDAGTGSGTQAYEDGVADGKGTITGITQRQTATYSETDKEYTVYATASGTKVTNTDGKYDAQLAVSGSLAYNHGHRIGVADGESHFTQASITLQGSAHAAITPIGTAHNFKYTHLYKAGSSVTYYQGNGASVTGRGTQVTVTPIGTSHRLRYTKLYKTNAVDADVQWAYVSDSSGSTVWYSAGTQATYYQGNGSSVTGRGDTVTITQQGSTQWAYVADSSGSTTYYDAGTQITGLYDAGTASTSYYTKNT